ncbi:hypothetical protein ACWGJ2_39970 [Streptomyces sp. NPDC054796]
MYRGTLDLGVLGLGHLVVTFLRVSFLCAGVPGAAEHLDDRRVSSGGLETEKPIRGGAPRPSAGRAG